MAEHSFMLPEPHGHAGHQHGDTGHHLDEGVDHSHVGLMHYVMVAVALCALSTGSFITTASWWPFHDQPQVGWAFMMAVSCTKAMLVILFFMHVKYEANWKYVLTIPCAFMSVFLLLMLVPDVGMRNRHASDEARQFMAEPARVSDQHGAKDATWADDFQ